MDVDEIKKEKLRVVQNIQNKHWSFRKLLKKDVPTHKAANQYYRIIWRLYDENNQIIFNWFCCSKCGVIIYCNLTKSGSKKLQNHKCYKQLLLDEKNQSKETNNDTVDQDTTDEIDDSVLNFQVPQNLLSAENQDANSNESVHSGTDEDSGEDEENDEENNDSNDSNDDDSEDDGSEDDGSNDDGQNPSYYSKIFHELSGLLESLKQFSHKEFKEIWPKTFNPTELYVKNNNL